MQQGSAHCGGRKGGVAGSVCIHQGGWSDVADVGVRLSPRVRAGPSVCQAGLYNQ